MLEQLLDALYAVVLGIGVCVLYFAGTNFMLEQIFPDTDDFSHSKDRWRRAIQPWLFLTPALVLLSVYLVYPVCETIRLSFFNFGGFDFVGLKNYIWAFENPEFLHAVLNNLLWLVFVPTLSVVFGLVVAVLADKVSWGTLAKSLIFMPMAISFVGASVIWKFVYDFRGPDADQIGSLNAFVMLLGGEPQAWITLPFWNNFFLMVILVWIQTGFAMVIFSAALRSIPEETLEAARIDGATEIQIFFKIMIPQIIGTILVVWTTITIIVLKIFDIVLAMTNGQWGTEVLANLMFDWMFRGGGDSGRGSVIALMIMIAVIPIMIWNIENFRKEEESR